MLRVAVLQSNYIPWKGYFDLIHDVDVFVFYDDVQYTKNDWRNRNQIKTPAGPQWITIPVGARLDRLICEVELPDDRWQSKHWKSLSQSYSRAPHWKVVESLLRPAYLDRTWKSLSELNQFLIREIAAFLGLKTQFRDSREFKLEGRRQDRLLALLIEMGTTKYLSGPSGRNYIEESAFTEHGIAVQFKDYPAYPEYEQLYPPFEHHVSIVDLLCMTGPKAPEYIWRNATEGGSA